MAIISSPAFRMFLTWRQHLQMLQQLIQAIGVNSGQQNGSLGVAGGYSLPKGNGAASGSQAAVLAGI